MNEKNWMDMIDAAGNSNAPDPATDAPKVKVTATMPTADEVLSTIDSVHDQMHRAIDKTGPAIAAFHNEMVANFPGAKERQSKLTYLLKNDVQFASGFYAAVALASSAGLAHIQSLTAVMDGVPSTQPMIVEAIHGALVAQLTALAGMSALENFLLMLGAPRNNLQAFGLTYSQAHDPILQLASRVQDLQSTSGMTKN